MTEPYGRTTRAKLTQLRSTSSIRFPNAKPGPVPLQSDHSDALRLAERAERKHFSDANPELPPETIVRSQFLLDKQNHVQLLCETRTLRFGIVIVTRDYTAMTWNEVRAVAASLAVVRRGAVLSDEKFHKDAYDIEQEFGRTRMVLARGRLFMVVTPSAAPHGLCSITRDEDAIAATALKLWKREIRVTAKTDRYHFEVRLATCVGYELSVMQCNAMQDVLRCLEPGDSVSPMAFFHYLYELRTHYNHGRLVQHSGNRIVYLLEPTASETGAPIEQQLHACSRPPENTQTPRPNGLPLVSGYELRKPVKSTPQCKEYNGVQLSTGAEVTLKLFNDDRMREKFKTEVRILTKICGHPNVANLIDFLETPVPCVVVSKIDGVELRALMRSSPKMEVRRALGFAVIAEGLHHLHKNHVVHRDLRPEHIIINEQSGLAVIKDFFCGRLDSLTSPGARPGPLQEDVMKTQSIDEPPREVLEMLYSPRERFEGVRRTTKSDVFSFGIILWEMLGGRCPYLDEEKNWNMLGLKHNICSGGHPNMQAVAHAPEHIKRLLWKCWKPMPQARPSMREVLDMLRGRSLQRIFSEAAGKDCSWLDYAAFLRFVEMAAPRKIAPEVAYDLFCAVDSDKDQKISLDEVRILWDQIEKVGVDKTLQSMLKLEEKPPNDITISFNSTNTVNRAARNMFDEIDIDNNGELDVNEFAEYLQKLSPNPIRLFQARAVFHALDRDNSSAISFDEFLPFWNTVEMKGFATAITNFIPGGPGNGASQEREDSESADLPF